MNISGQSTIRVDRLSDLPEYVHQAIIISASLADFFNSSDYEEDYTLKAAADFLEDMTPGEEKTGASIGKLKMIRHAIEYLRNEARELAIDNTIGEDK